MRHLIEQLGSVMGEARIGETQRWHDHWLEAAQKFMGLVALTIKGRLEDVGWDVQVHLPDGKQTIFGLTAKPSPERLRTVIGVAGIDLTAYMNVEGNVTATLYYGKRYLPIEVFNLHEGRSMTVGEVATKILWTDDEGFGTEE